MNPILIAIVGLVVTFGAIAHYFSTISRNKVPENVIVLRVSIIIGIVLVIIALFTGIPGSVGSVIGIILLAIITIFLGSFILWMLSQLKTPIGNIKVKVGDTILPFETKNSDGENFSTSQLRGKRTLLKFFRGAWCPYCRAELRMFNDMKSELDKYDIQLVALSGDSVEEAHAHKDHDNLNFTLLSNPDLSIIRQYGVEHHKALGADSKDIGLTLAGIPLPTKFKFKSMSIPTSLLIDEKGVIQWIDQSEDYRLRASTEEVFKAIKGAFTS
ncbi:MAG: peroxiredoxin family protein [Nitrosomonadaceae bacterium]